MRKIKWNTIVFYLTVYFLLFLTAFAFILASRFSFISSVEKLVALSDDWTIHTTLLGRAIMAYLDTSVYGSWLLIIRNTLGWWHLLYFVLLLLLIAFEYQKKNWRYVKMIILANFAQFSFLIMQLAACALMTKSDTITSAIGYLHILGWVSMIVYLIVGICYFSLAKHYLKQNS